MISRYLTIFSLLSLSIVVVADGLYGVPSMVSNTSQAVADPDNVNTSRANSMLDGFQNGLYEIGGTFKNKPGNGANYVEPVQQNPGIRNANDVQYAVNNTGSNANTVQQLPGPVSHNNYEPYPKPKIKLKLPKGVKTLKSDKNGAIDLPINSSGTFAVKSPPFLMNTIIFPDNGYIPKTPFGDSIVSIQNNHNIYLVTLLDDKLPISVVFLNTNGGNESISLVFVPDTSVISKTITITGKATVDKKSERVVNSGDVSKALIFEKRSSSSRRTVNAHKDISMGEVPAGYKLIEISNSDRGFICNEKRLVARLGQRLVGKNYEYLVFGVTNVSEEYVEFDESGCRSLGVVSAQMTPGWHIAPGENKEVIIQKKIVENKQKTNFRKRLSGV